MDILIHYWISINRFMDIQYSTDLLTSKNDLWISKIHLCISLYELWISINDINDYGYP